ncbi:hypothetical protein [Aliiruegeria sabulilitoris]|uniref:hypothetical protein n=1 Tax=Aliiruegeria sabulilitoris TaxID=1510458 RepID=UPI000832779E|nr:hypothetical protein [Aliiruegeria sabulilitoris]NDR55372.1 hypothetical protein [Pseudoruegeria sp. M32A2M]
MHIQSTPATMRTTDVHYAYLFEAKGIQSFIADTGRLVAIAGGSDLIAAVASSDGDDLLGKVLVRFPALEPSRRAGASFCLHGKDLAVLKAFRDAWLLTFGMYVPGLPYVDVLTGPHESSTEARRRAYETQGGVRRGGIATLLPLAPPGVQLAPRTGRPTSLIDPHAEGEAQDRAAAQTTTQGRRLAGAVRHEYRDTLARRSVGDLDNLRLPRHFKLKDANPDNPAFPFRDGSEDQRIGVVHADISGLGQLFIEISNRLEQPNDVLKVATAIENIIESAAQVASGPVVDKALRYSNEPNCEYIRKRWLLHFGYHPNSVEPEAIPALLPMRPVLLGGDDMTVILRADLAISFAQLFLEVLECMSEETLRKLWQDLGISDSPPCTRLTACAGVAIVSASHPFSMAGHMADGMCGAAKKVVKRIAANTTELEEEDAPAPPMSALTFAIVPKPAEESYEDFRSRERVAGGVALSAAPYVIGCADSDSRGLSRIETLFKVRDALEALGGLQGFREAMHSLNADGEIRLRRAAEVARTDRPAAFGKLQEALGLKQRSGDAEDGNNSADQAEIPLDRAGLLSDALDLIDIDASPLSVSSGFAAKIEVEPT